MKRLCNWICIGGNQFGNGFFDRLRGDSSSFSMNSSISVVVLNVCFFEFHKVTLISSRLWKNICYTYRMGLLKDCVQLEDCLIHEQDQ